jgi:ABC-type oligopeptide transport system ATPase subunit
MIVVNLFGGPGSGKSTTAHGLMYTLKSKGYNVEYSGEYAKELVYADDMLTLSNQFNVLREQERRLQILNNKVDIVINEEPLINGIVYVKEDVKEKMIEKSLRSWNSYNNICYYIQRDLSLNFTKIGRLHNLEESMALDVKILKVLNTYSPGYTIVPSALDAIDFIVKNFENQIKSEENVNKLKIN